MPALRVELGSRAYPVQIGSGCLDRLGAAAKDAGLRPCRAAIITDTNVARLYLETTRRSLLEAAYEPVTIEIPPGEASKSLAMLERVYDQLAGGALDRNSTIFALGGGVVGDLAGFAAATYLRGVALVQVPTTVVAQVDSALGGKSGVNLQRGKNLVGMFYQPRLIVADVALLSSLPEGEFREGLAEVIKYGAIMDAALFAELEAELPSVLSREPARLESLVYRSLKHKASVVERDEREGGLRAMLNFGHTVGHALEAATSFSKYLHGEAVAIGMAAAARLSSKYAGLSAKDALRLKELVSRAGLPVDLPPECRSELFLNALGVDKKRSGDGIEFVLIPELGKAVTRRLRFDEIIAQLT